jgi:hypothetical protein
MVGTTITDIQLNMLNIGDHHGRRLPFGSCGYTGQLSAQRLQHRRADWLPQPFAPTSIHGYSVSTGH